MPISFIGGGGSFTIVTVGINLRGAYDAGTSYATGDGVRAADGHTYVATAAASAGTAPPASPWALYSGPAGAGEQAVYQRTTTNTAPSTPVGDAPAGWTSSPQGVDGANPYEWVSIRSGHTGAWGAWSTPAVAYLAGDDLTGPEIVALLTALTGGDRLSFAALQVPDGSIDRDMLADDSVAGDAIQSDGIGAGKIATTAEPDILAALGITAQNVDDMFIGADIAGAIITFNKADGSTVTVTVPTSDDGGGLTAQQAEALIASWALATDPTGTVPSERLSAGTLVALLSGLTGAARLPMSAVQGEVLDAQIPEEIARDTEIANLVYGLAASMNGIQYRLAGSPRTLRNLNLTEPVHDLVNGLLVEGTGITLTYDDAAGTLTITATGGGGQTPSRSSVLYSAITTTVRAPTAADFTTDATGNRAATGNQIQMEGWQGNRQMHIAIPTSEADPTAIRQLGDPANQNFIGSGRIQFAKRTGTVTIGADGAHNVWSTNGLAASTLYEPAGTDAAPTFIIV